MAARTVGAALGPTDVPVSTVSRVHNAKEVRAHPHFYLCYDSPMGSFLFSLCSYNRGLLVLVPAW